MIKLIFTKIRPSTEVPYLPWKNTPNIAYPIYLQDNHILVDHVELSEFKHVTVLTFPDEEVFNAFEANEMVQEELGFRYRYFTENSINYTVTKQVMP